MKSLEALCFFKMEDIPYKCPLCCSKAFSSKELLIDHINNITENLHCPICNIKVPSLFHLTQHLEQDNCLIDGTIELETSEQINQIRSIILEKTQVNNESGLNNTNILEFKNGALNTSTSSPIQTIEAVNMFEIMKSRATQDVQFVKDVDGQYMIITEDADAVVTKQNNDGTISLTSVKEMKMETESQSSPELELEPEDIQEEMYSCNTCGVSFSSVIDHIQNYHNDQDVVVEEPVDPLEDEEGTKPERQTSRRVITETGDIVETPFKKHKVADEDYSILPDNNHQERPAGPGSKRYMRMNNLCDSVVRNLKQSDKTPGPSHKVLVKEVLTKDGEFIKYYHCVFCNINVSSLSDFKTQPCKTSKYTCTQCPVTYDNAKSLCAHMKVHKVKTMEGIQKPISETFECEVCCTVFPTNKSLKLHKRMHDPVRARHIEAPRNSDFSEMRYLCTVCEKMIPVDYRAIHENSHATEQNLLNCGICNKKFSSEEYLEMHMNVHNLDKAPPTKQDQSLPYSCVYCDRRFARPHEKVKHERIHTGEKPHCCEICGKSFRVSYCLTLHMRTHTGARPYACEHCGKRFKAHSVYNHHLLTHSEVRAYKCPYCPKAFKTSVQLAGHKNSHTKPFSCTHCNRPFASLYAVRVHTETHARTNNLKFSCSLCGASYARAFALRDHIKQQHKDENLEEDVKTKPVSNEEWVTVESCTDIEIKTSLATLDKEIAMQLE